MKEIFRCESGSRLFGTNLPDSDHDEKRIVLPSAEQILMGDASYAKQLRDDNHKKMAAGDEDVTIMSIQKLALLLNAGDVTAIETIFAPNLLGHDDEWERFLGVARRAIPISAERFRAYGKSQMLRYGQRGASLSALRNVVAIMKQHMNEPNQQNLPPRLSSSTMRKLEELTQNNSDVTLGKNPSNHEIPVLDVGGRAADLGARPVDVLRIFQKALDNVSERRAKAAERPDRADLKGIYHSLRIVDEGLELLRTGEIRFPLENADFYKAVRAGDVSVDEAMRVFNEKMEMLLVTDPAKGLSKEPDTESLRHIVIELHRDVIRSETTITPELI